MPKVKEFPEIMRKKVIEIHKSGKGYKAILKAHGFQGATVWAIISKWKKLGTVANVPRGGQPPRAQKKLKNTNKIIIIVTKDQRTTLKKLQASLASIKVTAWLHYLKDTGQKWHPWRSDETKTAANPEEL